MGVGWQAAAQVGLMPQYPPACPAGDWPGGLRVGAVQAWLGLAVSWARRALRSYPARHPPPRWPAAWILIPLLSAWTPLIPTPACPLATQPALEAAVLAWSLAGAHRREADGSDGSGQWQRAMAVGGRACLGARGPWRGHTLLCSPPPWPGACAWSPAPALTLAVHGPSGCRDLRATLKGQGPVWLWGVGCWGPLLLNCAGFCFRPGLEGHGRSARPALWVSRPSADFLQADRAVQREPGCFLKAVLPVRHAFWSQRVSRLRSCF